MQTGKNTIRNLFDGSKIFNVPIYQRAYSWKKEKHLQEFLEDIIGQYPERKYFLVLIYSILKKMKMIFKL